VKLGSRFSVGDAPHTLPPGLRDQIAEVESTLSPEEKVTLRWTLTWLENRPLVELDNGVTLGSASDG
jgi:hypothetical protein